MGFLPNHHREGPGIAPDAPRKTGFPRFWETLSRDFWDVFRAGFLALAGCLPFLAGAAFSLHSHVLLFAPVCGLLGGAIAGPELCALAGTILRGLGDEPGFWWHTYRRAWKRSAKASLLPALPGLFLIYPGINESFRIEERLRGKYRLPAAEGYNSRPLPW